MQKTYNLKTYNSLIGIVSILLAIASSFGLWLWPDYFHPLWFIILLFVALVQWTTMAYTFKHQNKKPQIIVKHYQVAKLVKLFLFLILLTIYTFCSKDKAQAFAFLIDFLFYYGIFFGTETVFVQKWFKSIGKESQNFPTNEE